MKLKKGLIPSLFLLCASFGLSSMNEIKRGKAETVEDTFYKFNETITEGDYVIAYNDCLMASTISGDYFACDKTATFTNNIVSGIDDSCIWHISNSDNGWTLYNAKNSVYAGLIESGHAKARTSLQNGVYWNISLNDAGAYDITNSYSLNPYLRSDDINSWGGNKFFGATQNYGKPGITLYKKYESETNYIDEFTSERLLFSLKFDYQKIEDVYNFEHIGFRIRYTFKTDEVYQALSSNEQYPNFAFGIAYCKNATFIEGQQIKIDCSNIEKDGESYVYSLVINNFLLEKIDEVLSFKAYFYDGNNYHYTEERSGSILNMVSNYLTNYSDDAEVIRCREALEELSKR